MGYQSVSDHVIDTIDKDVTETKKQKNKKTKLCHN